MVSCVSSPSISHQIGVVHHAGRRDQEFARGNELEELLGVAVADHIIRLAMDQEHRAAHLSDQLAVGIPWDSLKRTVVSIPEGNAILMDMII